MAGPSLLTLPAELRNKIYELALPLDDGRMWISQRSNRPRPHAVPALCRANRQLRRETLSMFRGRSEFFLEVVFGQQRRGEEPALVRWLRQFRRSGAESLRMLRVRSSLAVPYPCGFGGLACLVDVELIVQADEYWLGVWEYWPCPAGRGQRDRRAVKGRVKAEWVRAIERTLGRTLVEMRESIAAGGW